MIVKALTVLWVALCAAGCSSLFIRDPVQALAPKAVDDRVITRDDALADLEVLVRTLDHVHPDPYRFHPREVFEAERVRLIAELPPSLALTDLCVRFSRLTATLDDGHTGMSCTDLISHAWRRAAAASPSERQQVRMFPPYMRIDDLDHLVVSWPNDAPGVCPGDRLLRINGRLVDPLLAEWSRELRHDTEHGRRANIAREFRMHLALHGIGSPFHVEAVAPDGQLRDAIFPGEPVNYYLEGRPPVSVVAARVGAACGNMADTSGEITLRTKFFNYRIIKPDIAYMELFTLWGGFNGSGGFGKAVKTMFERIADDRPRVLIIDIRENGGGDDTIAADLLRHVTEKPFRLMASYQVKRSEEMRDVGTSMIRIPFRWMGLQYLSADARRYYRGEVGTLAPPVELPIVARKPAEPFFSGPVCVLTGPHTFSAASELAEAIKAFHLATIVGEETGGQPNSFGNPMPFPLRHSGLSVQVATARAVRASGNVNDNTSVKPDIVVRTTARDMKAGIDPVLDRARDCPARSP